MPEPDEAIALFELARQVLIELEQSEPGPGLGDRLDIWEATARRCYGVADRVSATAAGRIEPEPPEADRRRLLGHLAVRLAVNIEWTMATCTARAAEPERRGPRTERAGDSARDCLRLAALSVLRLLRVSPARGGGGRLPDP